MEDHSSYFQFISDATARNWKKLDVSTPHQRLTSRANKRLSARFILPKEYLSSSDSADEILKISAYINEEKINLADALYSLCLNLFRKSGLLHQWTSSRQNITRFLDEYNGHQAVAGLVQAELPPKENDILGLIYQTSLTEGSRNTQGIYYTPWNVAQMMTSGVQLEENQTFLDPSCGSGSFLLNAPCENPNQLFGMDNDYHAVMIAKANLILKYASIDFFPHIYKIDFLDSLSWKENKPDNDLTHIKFNYIITNPPWGAMASAPSDEFDEIQSGEIFSYFLLKSLKLLADGGIVNFLLPASFLNVKTHRDIRKIILDHYAIQEIQLFDQLFSGVTTKYFYIKIKNSSPEEKIVVKSSIGSATVKTVCFQMNPNYNFRILSEKDDIIIGKVAKKCNLDLKESLWALGIVTGNNKEKLSSVPKEGWEKIYTGKEIQPYSLKPPVKFIDYDRRHLQQAARDEYYRAPEKLVYKFISDKLVFAYDASRSLFLNSANILIPRLNGLSIKALLIFLNSELYQFIYKKKFAEIKILKGNLMELTFPFLTQEEDQTACSMADAILEGEPRAIEKAQNFVFHYFDLTQDQIEYVKENVHKKFTKRK